MVRASGTYGRQKRCIQGLGGDLRGKSPLVRPRCGWEDNIIMNLQDVGWRDMDWIDLAQESGR